MTCIACEKFVVFFYVFVFKYFSVFDKKSTVPANGAFVF